MDGRCMPCKGLQGLLTAAPRRVPKRGAILEADVAARPAPAMELDDASSLKSGCSMLSIPKITITRGTSVQSFFEAPLSKSASAPKVDRGTSAQSFSTHRAAPDLEDTESAKTNTPRDAYPEQYTGIYEAPTIPCLPPPPQEQVEDPMRSTPASLPPQEEVEDPMRSTPVSSEFTTLLTSKHRERQRELHTDKSYNQQQQLAPNLVTTKSMDVFLAPTGQQTVQPASKSATTKTLSIARLASKIAGRWAVGAGSGAVEAVSKAASQAWGNIIGGTGSADSDSGTDSESSPRAQQQAAAPPQVHAPGLPPPTQAYGLPQQLQWQAPVGHRPMPLLRAREIPAPGYPGLQRAGSFSLQRAANGPALQPAGSSISSEPMGGSFSAAWDGRPGAASFSLPLVGHPGFRGGVGHAHQVGRLVSAGMPPLAGGSGSTPVALAAPQQAPCPRVQSFSGPGTNYSPPQQLGPPRAVSFNDQRRLLRVVK